MDSSFNLAKRRLMIARNSFRRTIRRAITKNNDPINPPFVHDFCLQDAKIAWNKRFESHEQFINQINNNFDEIYNEKYQLEQDQNLYEELTSLYDKILSNQEKHHKVTRQYVLGLDIIFKLELCTNSQSSYGKLWSTFYDVKEWVSNTQSAICDVLKLSPGTYDKICSQFSDIFHRVEMALFSACEELSNRLNTSVCVLDSDILRPMNWLCLVKPNAIKSSIDTTKSVNDQTTTTDMCSSTNSQRNNCSSDIATSKSTSSQGSTIVE